MKFTEVVFWSTQGNSMVLIKVGVRRSKQRITRRRIVLSSCYSAFILDLCLDEELVTLTQEKYEILSVTASLQL